MRFEVLARDYLARVGRLTLGEVYTTPLIIERSSELAGRLVETKSAWSPSPPEEVQEESVVVLPHKCPPAGLKREAVSFYGSVGEDKLYNELCEGAGAKGEVVCPSVPDLVPPRELYVLGAARSTMREPRMLVECMLALREHRAYNIPVYAPAIAEPSNLAMLVLCGVDMVDDVACVDAAMRGEALTREARIPWEQLKCHCPECHERALSELSSIERMDALYRHNLWMLREELNAVRHYLALGRLREYAEAKSGFSRMARVMMSVLDGAYERVEPFVRAYSSTPVFANTDESLKRAEVVRFASRVIERFTPRQTSTLVVLPCSAKKPYSISKSHRTLMSITKQFDVQEVILTSPLGIVPRQLELIYPCAHYDIPVSGIWSENELSWAASRLARFLESEPYENVVVHAQGAFLDVCSRAAKEVGCEPTYTCRGSLTSPESLSSLEDTLASLAPPARENTLEALVRAMCDYQFGSGVSQALIKGRLQFDGRYPHIRVYENGEHLFSTVPEHGKLSLSLLSGERLLSCGVYTVGIDSFVPHGSITVRGVRTATPDIREGDEVVFTGERCMGVGTALMGASEMQTSTYGSCVSVRRYREL